MLHQTPEGLIFFWSEMYLFALLLYKAAIGVEHNITHYADQIWFFTRGMAPPNDSS